MPAPTKSVSTQALPNYVCLNWKSHFLQIYPTKDYLTFENALDALASQDAFKHNPPGAAAFACAGPVLDNKCVMTNLEWVIDGASLTHKYGIRYYAS